MNPRLLRCERFRRTFRTCTVAPNRAADLRQHRSTVPDDDRCFSTSRGLFADHRSPPVDPKMRPRLKHDVRVRVRGARHTLSTRDPWQAWLIPGGGTIMHSTTPPTTPGTTPARRCVRYVRRCASASALGAAAPGSLRGPPPGRGRASSNRRSEAIMVPVTMRSS